jgi:hypothetical protein
VTVDNRPLALPELGIKAALPRFLIAGLILVAAAAALAAAAWSATFADDQIRWGSVALALFCTGLLLLLNSAPASHAGLGLASWRLGPWSLLWSALAFGLATISWLGPQTGPPAEILPGSILRALWMIAAAMVMLTAGYGAGPWRLAAGQARRVTDALSRRYTEEVRGPVVSWALFGLGLVAQLASAATTGHFGYVGNVGSAAGDSVTGYSQVISIVGECLPLSVLTAAIRAHRTRTFGARVTLGILFTASVAAGAIAGGKTSFVVAVIAAIIPYTRSRRRLPVGLISAAVAFFLLIVIPFNLAYRESARGSVTLSTSQAIASAPAIAARVVASDLSLSSLGQSADLLAVRLRSIDSPAIIMQRTPSEIPYVNPAQLLVAPLVDVIPRALWPGKPVLATGLQMSEEYFELPAQIYTASAVTPEGDLYRHGGWFWLVAGMFVVGCGLRIFDESTDLRRSVHGAFLLLLLFPTIVMAGNDLATLLAGIPGMILLSLAVVAVSFKRRTATAA